MASSASTHAHSPKPAHSHNLVAPAAVPATASVSNPDVSGTLLQGQGWRRAEAAQLNEAAVITTKDKGGMHNYQMPRFPLDQRHVGQCPRVHSRGCLSIRPDGGMDVAQALGNQKELHTAAQTSVPLTSRRPVSRTDNACDHRTQQFMHRARRHRGGRRGYPQPLRGSYVHPRPCHRAGRSVCVVLTEVETNTQMKDTRPLSHRCCVDRHRCRHGRPRFLFAPPRVVCGAGQPRY